MQTAQSSTPAAPPPITLESIEAKRCESLVAFDRDKIVPARNRAAALRDEATALDREAREPRSEQLGRSQELFGKSRAKIAEAQRIERQEIPQLEVERMNLSNGNAEVEEMRRQFEKQRMARLGIRTKDEIDLLKARQMGARTAFQSYLVQIADPTLIRLARELRATGVPSDATLDSFLAAFAPSTRTQHIA